MSSRSEFGANLLSQSVWEKLGFRRRRAVERAVGRATREYAGEMIAQAPGGLVTKIFRESLPPGVCISTFLRVGFKQRGFVPKGATFDLVRMVLEEAPVLLESELIALIPDTLEPLEGTQLFGVNWGRGVEISDQIVFKLNEKVDEKQGSLLGGLAHLRAPNLLLGLWIAGCTSQDIRLGRNRYREAKVVEIYYPHDGGTATKIKMLWGTGNQLVRLAEDALIGFKGTL